jgi:hypothetical protein
MSSTGGTPTLEVKQEQFSARLSPFSAGIRVQFRGTISTTDPAAVLNPFVDAVHDRAVRAGEREVSVDLKDLEYCNSSGFKTFIHWIRRIKELPEDRRYKLRFLTSADRKWQRSSLLALTVFAEELVDILK